MLSASHARMFLQECHPILAILDDLAANLQRQFATSHGHHLGGLASVGQQRSHANFGNRGHRANGRLNLQTEIVLEQPAQFPSHLESKGVNANISDLAFTKERPHLLLENIPLSEQPLNWLLGLLEMGDEVFGQFRANCGVALFGLRDELFKPLMLVTSGKFEVVLMALHMTVMRVQHAPWFIVIGVCLYQSRNRGWSVLERFAHPVGFDQYLGSRTD